MDAWRIAGAVALAVLGLAAWHAGTVAQAGPNLATCRAAGAAAAGTVIAIHRESRVVGPGGPGEILVHERAFGEAGRARVTGLGDVPPGTSIGIRGRFEPPDRVVALAWHAHPGRFAKVWVSLPPLLWLAFALVRGWRPGPAGLEER